MTANRPQTQAAAKTKCSWMPTFDDLRESRVAFVYLADNSGGAASPRRSRQAACRPTYASTLFPQDRRPCLTTSSLRFVEHFRRLEAVVHVRPRSQVIGAVSPLATSTLTVTRLRSRGARAGRNHISQEERIRCVLHQAWSQSEVPALIDLVEYYWAQIINGRIKALQSLYS